jgi:hypothetical protein
LHKPGRQLLGIFLGGFLGYLGYCLIVGVLRIAHFARWGYFDSAELFGSFTAPMGGVVDYIAGHGAEYPAHLILLDTLCYLMTIGGAVWMWRVRTRGHSG